MSSSMADIPLDQMPFIPPPPGVKSNFDDPESRSYQLQIVIAVCAALMLPTFVCRVYTRLRVTRNWGMDDYAIVLATIFSILTFSLELSQLDHIYGIHAWDIRLVDHAHYSNREYASFSTGLWGLMFIRLSILLFYIRIFTAERHVVILSYIGMAIVVTFTISGCIAYWILCRPLPAPGGYEPASTCITDMLKVRDMITYMHAITDLWILVIPIKPVVSLQRSLGFKLSIYLIFLTGLLATLGSFLRVVWKVVYFDVHDFTWSIIPQYIFFNIEISLGIMCSCLPLVGKFFMTKRASRKSRSSERSHEPKFPSPRGISPVSSEEEGKATPPRHRPDLDDLDSYHRGLRDDSSV